MEIRPGLVLCIEYQGCVFEQRHVFWKKMCLGKTLLMLNKPVVLNLFQQLPSLAKQPAYPNKISRLKLTLPLPPNKINFRSASRRRKFGMPPPATHQIRKSANSQRRKFANPQINKSANLQIRNPANPPLPSQAQQPANPNKIFRPTLTSPLHPNKINF